MEFKNFVLVVAYVPNSKAKLLRLPYRTQEWDHDFFNYLKQLEILRKKPVVLTADMNVANEEIDVYNPDGKDDWPGFSPEERESFKSLLDQGFVDTFRALYPKKIKFTWWNVM